MINSNRDTIDTLDTFDTTLKTKTFRILTVLLVVLHFGLLVTSMWNSSAASDEPDYVGAGRYIVETGNWKFTSVQWHPLDSGCGATKR
ncbi:MAG: hypothetical protein JKX97_03185, partial [Candidatus Lindowbacteria bacterium]|nr:hypothetical protein [Candidatus Lindowbacteria bacterium]